jgi:group I intron endonuclease
MFKVYGIIYKATNKVSGSSYIGRTTMSLNKRIRTHINAALRKQDSTYFHNALRKHSPENFKWNIIAECNSIEELNKVEIEMIEKYNTLKNGYNLSLGGGSSAGYKHTEEVMKKRSKMCKGKGNNFYGKQHSKEAKVRMANSKSYYWLLTFPNNKKVVIKNLRKFCRENNDLDRSGLLRVSRGIQPHYKGYKCKRLWRVNECQK